MGYVKVLRTTNSELAVAGRWDLDYHLPAELIQRYPRKRTCPISQLARLSKDKRDPGQHPDKTFMYVDISSIDVETGAIVNPQELSGEEAPSRARMVIRAYDVLVSTCRPTRGAITVVPVELHNQICSTGFAVLRCHNGVNPFFLQYVLRLPSTLEQFRKLSTGSSYPAILDGDILNTIVPGASPDEQNVLAAAIVAALERWKRLMGEANKSFKQALAEVESSLHDVRPGSEKASSSATNGSPVSTAAILRALAELEAGPQGDHETSRGTQLEFGVSHNGS